MSHYAKIHLPNLPQEGRRVPGGEGEKAALCLRMRTYNGLTATGSCLCLFLHALLFFLLILCLEQIVSRVGSDV